jgi:1-acyl-sn-glycerol-3-phosphate acyltransferase
MDKIKKSNMLIPIIKPLARVWMWFDTNTKKTTEVDYKRKEPFVLLGNHVYLFDVVSLAMPWKISPAIVASEFLMSTRGLKFLLNDVAKIIPKSKGASDIRTVKGLLRYVKKGYPVMIMPEGDSTFFGETGYIEPATAKLIKKLNIDVIAGVFKGGYLSKPRWATGKRRRRHVRLHYKKIISKEEVKNLSEEEIYEIIKRELYHNDYEWQREVMHSFGGSRRAAGLENILYKCPECGALHSIETYRNKLYCSVCKTNGECYLWNFIRCKS